MARVVMIGAGSAGFCRKLVQDMLCFESLRNAHIVLMDVDGPRLKRTLQVMEQMGSQHRLGCTFSATTDRRKALKGADFAISMIQVGGLAPYETDLAIPLKYGIDCCVGDSLNPGGIFRGLRTVPALLGLLRDMEAVCPDVLFMNYANPMAICCWAMQQAFPHIASVGLCHGVQNTTRLLCRWLDLPMAECDVLASGINHMAWFLRFEHKGRDLYPALWKKLDTEGPIKGQDYRFEMFKATGYFMTETPGHLSEYLPYFRTRPDIQKLFGGGGFSGETGAYMRFCKQGRELYETQMDAWAAGREPVPFDPAQRSLEYAADIMNAKLTGQVTRFAGNILNKGYIPNLSGDACVEVPVFVDRLGMHGSHTGPLPDVCAALCQSNISVQRLAVRAALDGDREAAFEACLMDPLTAANLAPHEIRNMADELFAAQAPWLPQFKGKKPVFPGASIGRLKNGARTTKKGAVLAAKMGHYD